MAEKSVEYLKTREIMDGVTDAELLRAWSAAELLLLGLPDCIQAMKDMAAARRLIANENDAAH